MKFFPDSYVRKVDIDLARFDALLAKHGHASFGTWSDWGDLWGVKDDVRRYFYQTEERDTGGAAAGEMDDGVQECEDGDALAERLCEHVNLANLKRRVLRGDSRHHDRLVDYVHRCEVEGEVCGDYCTLKVQYYRKHGLPGRMYARGPALQWLAKKTETLRSMD